MHPEMGLTHLRTMRSSNEKNLSRLISTRSLRSKQLRCRKIKIVFKFEHLQRLYFTRILPLLSLADQDRSYLPEKLKVSADRFYSPVSCSKPRAQFGNYLRGNPLIYW